MFGKNRRGKRKSWFGKDDPNEEEVYEYTSTRITINGKEIDADFGDINDPKLIHKVSEQLDMSYDEAQKLLKQTLADQGKQKSSPSQRPGLLKKIDCPGCQRKVTNKQTYCTYCGYEFSEQELNPEKQITGSMLDGKYLEMESDNKGKQKTKKKDSFLQRILRM